MGGRRDPLSVRYDPVVDQLLDRAARAAVNRQGVLAWIASPTGEFRRRDRGGRTAHERAFMRSAYYRVFKNDGDGGRSGWALKLTWGSDADRKPSSRGRMARPVTIRMFPSWEATPGTAPWVGTARQSLPGHRIDD